MALLTKNEKDWLMRESFVSEYNRDRSAYIARAKIAYDIAKNRMTRQGYPLPDEQSFLPALRAEIGSYRRLLKMINNKYRRTAIYNSPSHMMVLINDILTFFAKLIIDEDWQSIV